MQQRWFQPCSWPQFEPTKSGEDRHFFQWRTIMVDSGWAWFSMMNHSGERWWFTGDPILEIAAQSNSGLQQLCLTLREKTWKQKMSTTCRHTWHRNYKFLCQMQVTYCTQGLPCRSWNTMGRFSLPIAGCLQSGWYSTMAALYLKPCWAAFSLEIHWCDHVVMWTKPNSKSSPTTYHKWMVKIILQVGVILGFSTFLMFFLLSMMSDGCHLVIDGK